MNYSEPSPFKCRMWLKKAYEDEGMTSIEIAKDCGVSDRLIRYYMNKFGIQGKKERLKFEKDIHLRISAYLIEDLKKASHKEGRTFSEIVRRAIFNYLYLKEKIWRK